MIGSVLLLGVLAVGEGLVTTPTIVATIAALAALAGAILTYQSSTRANQATDRKVDLEEHRDSVARLKVIIDEQDKYQSGLRAQIERMTSQLESVQLQLARERDVSQLLRAQVATLQDQVRTLQRMVDARPPRWIAAERDLRPDIVD